MTLQQFLLDEFEREVRRSRHALEQVPEGKYDWKPHDRSMLFGYLADLVATMPGWVAMQVTKDELDIAPTDGSTMRQEPNKTAAALVQALENAAAGARAALEKTNDAHLMTPWKLKARGHVVQEALQAGQQLVEPGQPLGLDQEAADEVAPGRPVQVGLEGQLQGRRQRAS